jgi:hypothetical protein
MEDDADLSRVIMLLTIFRSEMTEAETREFDNAMAQTTYPHATHRAIAKQRLEALLDPLLDTFAVRVLRKAPKGRKY